MPRAVAVRPAYGTSRPRPYKATPKPSIVSNCSLSLPCTPRPTHSSSRAFSLLLCRHYHLGPPLKFEPPLHPFLL